MPLTTVYLGLGSNSQRERHLCRGRREELGAVTGRPNGVARMPASVAAAVLAVERGASIVRVHDVAATAEKSLEEVELSHILATLEHTGWNKSRTSQILGIERSTLDRKIKKDGIIKILKGAPLLCKGSGRFVGFLLDKSHDLFGHGKGRI